MSQRENRVYNIAWYQLIVFGVLVFNVYINLKNMRKFYVLHEN